MSNYTVLILGSLRISGKDTNCQEIERNWDGEQKGLGHLKNLINQADYTMATLSHPLVDPISGVARKLKVTDQTDWADPITCPSLLRFLGIDALNLVDSQQIFGDHGLDSTRRALKQAGIAVIPQIGTGEDAQDQALQVFVPNKVGGGYVEVLATSHRPPDKGSALSRLVIQFTDSQDSSKHSPDSLSESKAEGATLRVEAGRQTLHWDTSATEPGVAPTLTDISLGQALHLGSAGIPAENPQISGALFVDFHQADDQHPASARLYPLANSKRQDSFAPRPAKADEVEAILRSQGIKLSARKALRQGLLRKDPLGYYFPFTLPQNPEQQDSHQALLDRVLNAVSPTSEFAYARNTYTEPELFPLRLAHAKDRRNLSVLLLTEAAERLDGATTTWIDRTTAISDVGDKKLLWCIAGITESGIAGPIVGDKVATSTLLRDANVSAPQSASITNADEGIEFYETLGRPIVIKPQFGAWAQGVSVNLSKPKEIEEAFARAEKYGAVMAEEYIPFTQEFRCVTNRDECVAVVERILPFVVGNGVATVEELINQKNLDRKEVPSTYNTAIPRDDETISALARRGLSLDSILADGEVVTVRDVGGLSQGGEPRQSTKTLPAGITELAVRAANAIPGLDWCGVDIVVEPGGKAYVVEINTNADMTAARFPHYGSPVDVGAAAYTRRRDSSRPTVEGEPPHLIGLSPAPQLGEALVFREGTTQNRLRTLLSIYLEQNGWSSTPLSRSVQQFTKEGSKPLLLAKTKTKNDFSAIMRVISTHARVRLLLRNAEIPIPKAVRRRGASIEADERFQRSDDRIVQWGYRSWTGKNVLENGDLPTHTPKGEPITYISQRLPAGKRLTVYATPSEPIAVTASEPVDQELLDSATDLAVKAVRAIPGLRWAAVSIVKPDGQQKKGRSLLVEGMSIDPMVRADDLLIAGDFPRLWDTITEVKTADA